MPENDIELEASDLWQLNALNSDHVCHAKEDRFIVLLELDEMGIGGFEHSTMLNNGSASFDMNHHFFSKKLADNHSHEIIRFRFARQQLSDFLTNVRVIFLLRFGKLRSCQLHLGL